MPSLRWSGVTVRPIIFVGFSGDSFAVALDM